MSFYGDICLYSSAKVSSFFISIDDSIIGFQEIPGIPYSDPSPMCFHDRVASFSYIDVDKVCDLELTSGREGNGSELLEYGIIELMISDIGEISDSGVCRFFYETCSFSCRIYREYPKILRYIHSLTESTISYYLRKIHDVSTIIEVISRYDDEFS